MTRDNKKPHLAEAWTAPVQWSSRDRAACRRTRLAAFQRSRRSRLAGTSIIPDPHKENGEGVLFRCCFFRTRRTRRKGGRTRRKLSSAPWALQAYGTTPGKARPGILAAEKPAPEHSPGRASCGSGAGSPVGRHVFCRSRDMQIVASPDANCRSAKCKSLEGRNLHQVERLGSKCKLASRHGAETANLHFASRPDARYSGVVRFRYPGFFATGYAWLLLADGEDAGSAREGPSARQSRTYPENLSLAPDVAGTECCPAALSASTWSAVRSGGPPASIPRFDPAAVTALATF